MGGIFAKCTKLSHACVLCVYVGGLAVVLNCINQKKLAKPQTKLSLLLAHFFDKVHGIETWALMSHTVALIL